MASTGRVYVDANVFIRTFEGTDELSDALSSLLLSGAGAEPRFVTSELTLAEVLVMPYRDGNDHLIDVYEGWMLTNDYVEVAPIDRGVLLYASVLRSQHPHLKLPDAIHISTAIGLRCSHMLTGDQRLHHRYELIHRRYGTVSGSVVVEIIRPDLQTIKALTRD